MLSLAAISISFTSLPGVPFTFILNWDKLPPSILIELTFIFWFWGLYIFNDAVKLPRDTNTVSNIRVSTEKRSSPPLSRNFSLRQLPISTGISSINIIEYMLLNLFIIYRARLLNKRRKKQKRIAAGNIMPCLSLN